MQIWKNWQIAVLYCSQYILYVLSKKLHQAYIILLPALYNKFLCIDTLLFIIYSSTYIKELIWLLFSVFSTKNLSSVVKMMMTVSKQRAGGGVLDTDDKQSLIDDIETGDWCLSPISCIYVALSKFFFNLRSTPPPPKKGRGL